MDPKQLLLQLGLAGALIYFGHQIAKLLIASWRASESERLKAQRESESERTTAIAVGFQGMASAVGALVAKVDSHSTIDLQSHVAMATQISEIRGQITEALAWQERTPIGGVPAPPQIMQLPQQHPAIQLPAAPKRSATPPAGAPTTYSMPRGKTHG